MLYICVIRILDPRFGRNNLKIINMNSLEYYYIHPRSGITAHPSCQSESTGLTFDSQISNTEIVWKFPIQGRRRRFLRSSNRPCKHKSQKFIFIVEDL